MSGSYVNATTFLNHGGDLASLLHTHVFNLTLEESRATHELQVARAYRSLFEDAERDGFDPQTIPQLTPLLDTLAKMELERRGLLETPAVAMRADPQDEAPNPNMAQPEPVAPDPMLKALEGRIQRLADVLGVPPSTFSIVPDAEVMTDPREQFRDRAEALVKHMAHAMHVKPEELLGRGFRVKSWNSIPSGTTVELIGNGSPEGTPYSGGAMASGPRYSTVHLRPGDVVRFLSGTISAGPGCTPDIHLAQTFQRTGFKFRVTRLTAEGGGSGGVFGFRIEAHGMGDNGRFLFFVQDGVWEVLSRV